MVNSDKNEENLNKLSVSKKVSENLSYNLQQLNEKVCNCITNIDTSNVENVLFCNGVIDKLNDLIDIISQNQGTIFEKLQYLNLTDDLGQVATEYKLWVVGEFFVENGVSQYYKRRIVEARTPKEAIYAYKKVDSSLGNSLICFGEQDESQEYSQGIDNMEVIS